MAKPKQFGIKAIIRLYSKKLILKGAKLPLFITVLIMAIYCFYGHITKETLGVVIDLILSIIPNLLGFVLSGYALLIGFGNIELIAKKTKPNNENTEVKPTLYQKVSVFAVGLIMQIFLLAFSFVLKLILKLELPCLFGTYCICNLVNYIVFGLFVFGLLYVTVMIKDLVINIFNFSQVQHIFINKPKQENNDLSDN